jgi:hypothetical protein
MMTDYLSNLPVELIEKIFDDLPMFDILGSLILVNKRLRLISFGYRRFRVHLSYIKRKKQFNLVCDQLTSISSQIVSLSFSNYNDATIPSKIELFFLRFQFINDTFSNLKSLHLSKVDLIMWKTVQHHVKSLMTLVSLSIDVVYMLFGSEVSEFVSYLLNDILFLSISLKYIYVKANNISVHTLRLDFREEQISSIEHLTLLDIPIDLEQLYPHVPSLRTLDANLRVYHPAHQFRLHPSENLRQLSLNIYHLYFSTIEQLLYPMRRLTDLIIIASDVYNDMSDGAAWERILARIISFKFSFTFHEKTWIEEPIKLDSFQSLFWLEKKQWYVGYDRCSINGFSLLYSIPYLMNTYPWNTIKGPVDTKSTGPQVVSLNNIDRFTFNKKLPIDNNCLRRLVNLEQIFIDESGGIIDKLLDNMVPYIDMSRITTLSITELSSNINSNSFIRLVSITPHLRSLGASIVLLKFLFVSHWPNIRQLKILLNFPSATITEKSLTVNEIVMFYRSFTHLEYLSFYQDAHLNPSILLNNIPTTISNIVIYHPVKITPDEFPDFITCDWLEQNTCLRHFFYSCNQLNAVSLWF